MFTSSIPPRMKQSNKFPSSRISSRNIRTFVSIAVKASEREIFEDSLTAMLPRNDVIDVEGERINESRQTAVFTTILGSLPGLPDEVLVHEPGPFRGFTRRASLALDCMTARRLPTCK
jgi:hypothetical protein